jgi:hypothetical protein
VLAATGERLAKRNRPASVGDLRAAGVPAETIVAALAASAGLVEAGRKMRPGELVGEFELGRVRRGPVEIP